MGDVAAAAAAPAAGQVAIEPAVAIPVPLSNESTTGGGKGDVVEPKAPPTAREALKAAAEKVAKENPDDGSKPGDKAGDPKDLSKGAALARGEGGKFAPKDGKQPTAADTAEAARVAAAAATTPEAKAAAAAAAAKPGGQAAGAVKHAAPERFSPDAKTAWETAPEPVKAEVHRMQRELEAGIEKHRVGAQKYDTVKDFDELASKNGTNLRTALTKYVNTEHLLRTNPLKGLEAICSNMGFSLRQVAEVVMGQAPDQRAAQSDGEIRELKATVARLEQRVGGVTQTFQQQEQRELHDHIAKWSAGKLHFELLAPHIAEAVRDGATLDDAYQGALAKFPELSAGKPPATDTTLAASAAAAEASSDQTGKGQRSIAGARNGSGSDPVDQTRPTSIKESLRRASARV
jgi:hypothetical protein